jgi:hypothetical protein
MLLFAAVVVSSTLRAQPIPFEVCTESTTWVRLSPEVQAKVWNQGRYKDFARDAYESRHDFFVIDDPESANVHEYFNNLSGVWTALRWAAANVLGYSDDRAEAWTAAHGRAIEKCPNVRHGGGEWIEVWSLLHSVKEVRHDNNTYTFTVDSLGKGFQQIYVRRMNVSAVLRFETTDGKELERWDESAPPNQVRNPPSTVVLLTRR